MSKYLELVEDSFSQEHLDKQKNQNPYVAYSIKDGKVIYTIVPQDNGMYKVLIAKSQDVPSYNPNMVDLGLPSGTLWSDRNVGSDSPEDFGMYYAWGETDGVKYLGVQELDLKKTLELLSIIWGQDVIGLSKEELDSILTEGGLVDGDLTVVGICFIEGDKVFNWDNYFDLADSGTTFNKYTTDKLTVLESVDDVAYTSSNGQYRIPTEEEILELIINTTPTFIDLQGNGFSKEEVQNDAIESDNLKGVRLTATNGNSIFIPAAGYCSESLLIDVGVSGRLWSSSLDDSSDGYAKSLYLYYNGNVNEDDDYRCYGASVRGVKA